MQCHNWLKTSQPRAIANIVEDCYIHLCFSRSTVDNFTISVVEFSVKAQKAERLITEVLPFILCADVYGETVS